MTRTPILISIVFGTLVILILKAYLTVAGFFWTVTFLFFATNLFLYFFKRKLLNDSIRFPVLGLTFTTLVLSGLFLAAKTKNHTVYVANPATTEYELIFFSGLIPEAEVEDPKDIKVGFGKNSFILDTGKHKFEFAVLSFLFLASTSFLILGIPRRTQDESSREIEEKVADIDESSNSGHNKSAGLILEDSNGNVNFNQVHNGRGDSVAGDKIINIYQSNGESLERRQIKEQLYKKLVNLKGSILDLSVLLQKIAGKDTVTLDHKELETFELIAAKEKEFRLFYENNQNLLEGIVGELIEKIIANYRANFGEHEVPYKSKLFTPNEEEKKLKATSRFLVEENIKLIEKLEYKLRTSL